MNHTFAISIDLVRKLNLSVRVELKNDTFTEWSKWLTVPSMGYFELATTGPYRQIEAVAIELDSIQKIRIGRLVPDQSKDMSIDLEEELKRLNIVYMKHDSIFRIPLTNE